jgi:glycerol-3-phosphate acyltransferase PlsY
VPVLAYIIVAVAAYLLGSIPTGYLVAKAKGIDIQKSGSGNIGATNAMRVLGKPAGIFVMVVDAAKGYGAVYFGSLIVKYLMDHRSTASPGSHDEFIALENAAQFLPIIAGICAVLGHNYPCWLKFKGGKGIATTAGVYLAFAPVALLIALAVFILTILVTRYVSVGSIAAAIVLPVAVWFNCGNLFFESVTIALSLLAIYKHKSNIKRLMAGTESRFGKKPEDAK